MSRKNHMWTKAEIAKLLKLWESKTIAELCVEMNMEKHQIQNMATQIRLVDPRALPKKHHVGYLKALITEVLNER